MHVSHSIVDGKIATHVSRCKQPLYQEGRRMKPDGIYDDTIGSLRERLPAVMKIPTVVSEWTIHKQNSFGNFARKVRELPETVT